MNAEYDCHRCNNRRTQKVIPRSEIESGKPSHEWKSLEGEICCAAYWWLHPENYPDVPKAGECEDFERRVPNDLP